MKRKAQAVKRSRAARAGWVTRRRHEAEREAERERRASAARRAWAERRRREAEEKAARARASRKGWRKRRKREKVRKREAEVLKKTPAAAGAVSLSRVIASWFGYREASKAHDVKLGALTHGGTFRCYIDFGLFPPKALDPSNYLELEFEGPPSDDLESWWKLFYDTGRAALEAAKGETGESESLWCAGIDFIPNKEGD